jgi:hypothetical protein
LYDHNRSSPGFADRGQTPAVLKSLINEVVVARRAIDHGQLTKAEPHLLRAVESRPDWAEAWGLMGALRERLGEHHSAYQCYRVALVLDRFETLSLGGMRRYCERFGLDFSNPAINPAARASLASPNPDESQ